MVVPDCRYDVELFQKIEQLTGQKMEIYPTEQVHRSCVDTHNVGVCMPVSVVYVESRKVYCLKRCTGHRTAIDGKGQRSSKAGHSSDEGN